MQVKKFEAKTIREALEMVKAQLGPDAIILSAKEHSNRFGLVGQKSVEVTAAISEEMLNKKRLIEAKLDEKTREKFKKIPARQQKEVIEKFINKYKEKKPSITPIPYIQITDDADISNEVSDLSFVEKEVEEKRAEEKNLTSGQRIRNAARDALKAIQFLDEDAERKVKRGKEEESSGSQKNELHNILKEKDQRITSLQRELIQLKQLVSKFQSVPKNFINAHPGAEFGVPYDLSFMFEKLVDAGISAENASEILSKLEKTVPLVQRKKRALVLAWVVKYFLQNIKVVSDWSKGRYHVFVGITGQGKSSSLVKLASHLVIKEKKKIAIVSCDTYKVGASEQLKIFSQILNVPFACIKSASQWSALEQKLKHYDRVLVDLPGKSLKTPSEVDLLFRFIPPFASKSVHYVQSILSKDQEAFEVARRFQQIGFHDVIFTHLDEAHHFGLLYNFQKEFGVPLHSFGTGSKVPEDYEPATKERVVDLIFKLTERKSHGISATAF